MLNPHLVYFLNFNVIMLKNPCCFGILEAFQVRGYVIAVD